MTASQIIGGLYIGDIRDVTEGDTSNFDHVVGVCQTDASDNVGCEYSHFCLSDGEPEGEDPGVFTYELFKEAVDAVVAARIRRETVLVHCHMGVSRSAAVCIAALAVVEGMEYKEAYQRVSGAKYIQPSPELVEFAKRYTEEH